MEIQRRALAEWRDGKLRRALGRALPGELRNGLERLALKDEPMAEEGLVKLKLGDRT